MGSGGEIGRSGGADRGRRGAPGLGAWLIACALAPLAAPAQEPAPARIRGVALGGGQSVELVLAWRYQPGDDPRWAEPEYDDTGWATTEPRRADEVIPTGAEEGVAWFRRHLEVDAGAGREPLRLAAVADGELRVFLDGELLLETHGGLAEPGGPAAGTWATVRLAGPGRHLLAVRYVPARGSPVADATGARGFLLTLEGQTAAAEREAGGRRRAALAAIAIALPALLALVHFALYLSHRKERENLFYALAMLAFIGIVACDLDFLRTASDEWRRVASTAAPLFVLAACFFVLLTHQAVRLPRLAPTWIGFAIAAVLLGLLTLVLPNPAVQSWSWYFYFAAMSLEIVRLEVRGPTVRRPGAHLLLAGLIASAAIILLQILINLGAVPPPAGVRNVYVFGILALAVAMSLLLAHTAAARSVQLERRLAEVRSLSEQVLSQERAALERALEARLVAAEHARKTAEIEAARALQLSLLPRELPQPAGLEVAAAMTTASEVGGDYYDFRLEADGGLVVAIGDATGHGVVAGTMVTAAKALFSVLDLGRGLGAALAECDRALR
ncbi:MAG TPA: 7TM diverse intracellular signaling domain-containing protein, partial [Thermoanaerobaculia bacterium]|nr:7TM diverse intracellular signaling domain-containing protein [Thermoanaerobaculia bacterium]